MMIYDLILKGGIVVNHQGKGLRDVGVKNGRIAELGSLSTARALEVIDCRGLHVLPGVIDSHVHFREPGLEHKETFETGSRAAVLGGVTTVFDMPNTIPPLTNEQRLQEKLGQTEGRMYCDFAFWIGGTRENAACLSELERLPGVAGVKVFMGSSTGDLLVEDDEGVFSILSNTRRRTAFHSEDETRLGLRLCERYAGDPSSHSLWRDEMTALISTHRLVSLAQKAGSKIHVLHVSSGEEIAFLEHNKDLATCEVTPHHLTLSCDDYARLGSLIQMNPPVRSSTHRSALWQAIQRGAVDVLGSDHAPHTLEEKNRPYPFSPSGITGVQTLVPLMLNHVAKGRLSIEDFVHLTAHGPYRVFGLARKGLLAKDFDADFTVVDLGCRKIISNEIQASCVQWTPYDGYEVTGWPILSIIRGKCVMREGEILEKGFGKPATFTL